MPRLSASRMNALTDQIWPPEIVRPADEGLRAYVLIDSARLPGLYRSLADHQDELPIRSLYQGDMASQLADVSPYLAALDPAAPFARHLIEQSWGESWAVFLHAEQDIDAVRRHCRRFTIVNSEDGKALLFRFYDPRVLRSFLPTCSEDQLASLFRDVVCYFTENDDGASLKRFEFSGGELRIVNHPLPE